jgi:hypothetical protein
MPFKSEKQRRYMHWAASKGKISPKVVDEFEAATPKNRKLPERAPEHGPQNEASAVDSMEKGASAADVAKEFGEYALHSLKRPIVGGLSGGIAGGTAASLYAPEGKRDRAALEGLKRGVGFGVAMGLLANPFAVVSRRPGLPLFSPIGGALMGRRVGKDMKIKEKTAMAVISGSMLDELGSILKEGSEEKESSLASMSGKVIRTGQKAVTRGGETAGASAGERFVREAVKKPKKIKPPWSQSGPGAM